MSNKIILVVVAILAIAINISVAYAQNPAIINQTSPDIGGLISSLLTNPTSLVIFVIQLGLGLGLGYFSAKVFKYMLALIGIFVVGVLLNVWQLSQSQTSQLSNIQQQLSTLSVTWGNLYPVIMSLIYQLGLTTVLPITLGFVIGLVIAIAK